MREFLSGSDTLWLEDLFEGSENLSEWEKFLETDTDIESKTERLSAVDKSKDRQHRVDALVETYRELGHLYASINPLGSYMPPNLRYAWITQQGIGKELEPSTYGLGDSEMDEIFIAPASFNPPPGHFA